MSFESVDQDKSSSFYSYLNLHYSIIKIWSFLKTNKVSLTIQNVKMQVLVCFKLHLKFFASFHTRILDKIFFRIVLRKNTNKLIDFFNSFQRKVINFCKEFT